MKQSIGFIGGGRITRILLQAFCNKDVEFSTVAVADTNSDVALKLKSLYPFIRIEDASFAAKQDIVFISLHPPVIMDTLDLIQNDVRSNATIISLAPKINIARISSKLGQVKNIARLIPNATSYINDGFNPVCFSSGFDQTEKDSVLDLIRTLGHTFEVAEEKLESYAIVSAMLPTYFWFQWNYLEEIGIKTGLSKSEAEEAVHQTILAAINLMYTSELKPEEVIDLIPVKPIGEHEVQITEIYKTKLLGLFEKIKP
ncbi:MAG TPA: NAD(P)-binding domain-containing protein [Bacteroidales bacterium]|nr:NAD(P)-binding domain-containing protein [Bacteroidales bacterium]